MLDINLTEGQGSDDFKSEMEEETSIKNNETEDGDDSPDFVELSKKLSAQEKSSRTLGNIAKASVEVLIRKAKGGDEEAQEAINSNPTLSQYAEKHFGKDLFQKKEQKAEDIYFRVKKDLETDRQNEEVKRLIESSGLKGEETIGNLKKTVKALIANGDTVQDAFDAAYFKITKNAPNTLPDVRGAGFQRGNAQNQAPTEEQVKSLKEKYSFLSDDKLKSLAQKLNSFGDGKNLTL